jgi:WD40 repeat protein
MRIKHLIRFLVVLLTTLASLTPLATRAAPSAAGVWTMTGVMHQARGFQAATLLLNGLVLVAGGCGTCSGSNPDPNLTSAELYHPRTGSWARTGAMHEPRVQFTATLLRDGRVLVVGGCRFSICTSVLAGAELYDPRTGKWTRTGSLHVARWADTATLLPDGRVLVAGGASNCINGNCSAILASAELYDPQTGTWAVTGPMPQARARHAAALLPDGRVLVAGGAADGAQRAGGNSLAGAEIYDPHSGKWALTGSLHTAAHDRGATLLPDGQVLVEGGQNDSGGITGAELYHPRTGTWTVTGSLHISHGYQTGGTPTLLPNGQVLVAGNAFDSSGTPIADAELYHPATGAWTMAPSTHEARLAPTATLLPNGEVLVAGGAGNNSILADAELYHP